MRRKVAKELGRAGKTLSRNKGKVGLAAAGVALVAGALVVARKRMRRRRTDGSGAVASEPQHDGVADSAESAMHIPLAIGADLRPRGDSRKGTMKDAPVAGALFNEVREDRKESRVQ